jgi:hypothetical protein
MPAKRASLAEKQGIRVFKKAFYFEFFHIFTFLPLQCVVWQEFTGSRTLQKKSCRKTYGRFSVSWEL